MPVYSKGNYAPEINKNRIIAKSLVKPLLADPKTEEISACVKQLIKKEITVDEFSKEMKTLNVKLDTFPINKILRETENGVDVAYRKVLSCVIKNKDQDNMSRPFEERVSHIKATKAHEESKSTAELTSPKNKKKQITTPTYMSQKDLYDWDTNSYNDALKQESAVKLVSSSSLKSIFSKQNCEDPKYLPIRKENKKNERSIISVPSTAKLAKHAEIDLLCTKINPRIKYKNNSSISLSTPKAKTLNYFPQYSSTKSIKNKSSLDMSINSNSTMTTRLPKKNMTLHMTSQENFLAK